MYDITSRLEVNFFNNSLPVVSATEYAVKNRISALVVNDCRLIPPVLASKYSTNGRYKVILAIDFPKGLNYVLDKFKNLDEGFTGCDGFDILLTEKDEISTRNEVKIIRDFLREINPLYDVRFTLGVFNRKIESIEYMLKAIKDNPPSMIRLDQHLEMPKSRVTVEAINKQIDIIRRYSPVPLKLGTNVDLPTILAFRDRVAKFDIAFEKSYNLLKDIQARANPTPIVNDIPKP